MQRKDADASDVKLFPGGGPEKDREFLDKLTRELDQGFGFVPFLGAGFSAPSGVPLTPDLHEYLKWCICIAIGLELAAGESEVKAKRVTTHMAWNPRTDRWPLFSSSDFHKPKGTWDKMLFSRLDYLRSRAENDLEADKSLQEELWICRQAYGAMADWRSALQFLSRITREDRSKLPALGAEEPNVRDSFFREILPGRYPTLGHRMLAALASAMRIDLILTTNFDDLIERAFEAGRNKLQEFEITPGSPLPLWTSVSLQRSIIKLHGGRQNLRADYSLDQELSSEEREHYLTYFLSSPTDKILRKAKDRAAMLRAQPDFPVEPKTGFVRRHLLVIGFRASDARIWKWICDACKNLGPEFKVFWICHTEDDLKTVTNAVKEESLGRNFEILQHTNSSFLLLQLYQQMRRTLPPLGAIFPSTSRMTFPPVGATDEWDSLVKLNPLLPKFEQELHHAIMRPHQTGELIVVYSSKNAPGITSACSRSYRHFEGTDPSCIPLWIDLSNITSADHLFEIILESIYYRLGVEEWIPSTVARPANQDVDYAIRGAEIARQFGNVNKTWLIYINARELPGANSRTPDVLKPNGWLDEPEGAESADRTSFTALVKSILSKSPKVKIILQARIPAAIPSVKHGYPVTDAACWPPLSPTILPLDGGTDNSQSYCDKASESCIDWAFQSKKQARSRLRFLYGIVWMQRPRFPAAILSEALNPDKLPMSEIQCWLDELCKKRLIRYKPGGMVWLHSIARQRLRVLLEERLDAETIQIVDRPHVHRLLAEWYQRAVNASESPDAVFESADHYCRAAEHHLKEMLSRHVKSGKAMQSQRSIVTLRAAIFALESAASIIRANRFLIQTHGYSRGSCRRLEDLCAQAEHLHDRFTEAFDGSKGSPQLNALRGQLDTAIFRIWATSIDSMRAIAREVGEDSKAFLRHRQFVLVAAGTPFQEALTLAKKSAPPPDESGYCSLVNHLWGGTDRASKWRWHRWSMMLHVSARSYDKALKIVKSDDLLGNLDDQWNFRSKGMFKQLKSQTERIEFLRLIEQAAELQMLRMSVAERLSAGSPTDEEVSRLRAMGESTLALIHRGRKLAAKVRESDSGSDSYEASVANWCEVRMLMHESALLIFHRSLNLNNGNDLAGLFATACGTLSDAEARLRTLESQRQRSELALIDLYRAEIRLSRSRTEIHEDLPGLGIASLGLLLSPRCIAKLSIGSCEPDKLRKLFQSNSQRLLADVSDALRFLTRSEVALRERRRNVWWTTWFFERKLRAISLSVLYSCGQLDSPIPFLGLEAAMRLAQTEADQLLATSTRMIRVDSYRMATVLEAYYGCLIALLIRLHLDPHSPRLENRIASMKKQLEDGLAHLVSIKNARETADTYHEHKHRFLPDEDVQRYVDETVDAISASLRSDLFKHLVESGSK